MVHKTLKRKREIESNVVVFFSTDKTATDLEVEEKKGGEEDEKGEQSESKLPSSGCPVSS